MKALRIFPVLILAVSGTRLRQQQAVRFGPADCVSLELSGSGTCVITTDCQGQDTSNVEFAFDCEGAEGDAVMRHSFGRGGFDANEQFDTEVRCSRCSAPSPLGAAEAPGPPPQQQQAPAMQAPPMVAPPGGKGDFGKGKGDFGKGQQWGQQDPYAAEQRRQAEQKQREEEYQRKQEENRKWREEQEKRRKEEEEKRKAEGAACQTIRHALRRLRNATLEEDFDALKAEVTQTVDAELPKCGSQQQSMKKESDQAMEQASQHLEQLKEQARKAEEKRLEEEKRQAEREAEAKKLIAEVSALVAAGEEKAAALKEAAGPALEAEGLDSAALKSQLEAPYKLAPEAQAACRASAYLLADRGTLVKEVKDHVPSAKEECVELQKRIHKSLELVFSTSKAVLARYKKAEQLLAAAEKLKKVKDKFDKLDGDSDGMLSKKEVAAFAKTEYGYELPAATLATIMSRFAEGDKGVPWSQFHSLKMAIAIAREEEAARVRIREAAERARRLAELEAELKEKAGKVEEALGDDLEPKVAKAEEAAKSLADEELAGSAASEALAAVEESLGAARTELDDFLKSVKELAADLGDEALRPSAEAQTRRLTGKADAIGSRLSAVEQSAKRAKDRLAKQERAECTALKAKAVKVFRAAAAEAKKPMEDLYASIVGDKEAIDREAFVDFLKGKGAESEGDDSGLSAEQLERLFSFTTKEPLSKDAFLRFASAHYYVVKEIAMTAEEAMTGAKPVRKLQVDEVIEVKEGPNKDDKGITRLRGRAVKDGAEGWVSLVGNSGSVFLEECSAVCKVLQETKLTSSCAPAEEEGNATLRSLSAGDKLEVLEWDTKHDGSGLAFVRARMQDDGGQEGWVARVGQDGAPLMRPEVV